MIQNKLVVIALILSNIIMVGVVIWLLIPKRKRDFDVMLKDFDDSPPPRVGTCKAKQLPTDLVLQGASSVKVFPTTDEGEPSYIWGLDEAHTKYLLFTTFDVPAAAQEVLTRFNVYQNTILYIDGKICGRGKKVIIHKISLTPGKHMIALYTEAESEERQKGIQGFVFGTQTGRMMAVTDQTWKSKKIRA